MKEIGNESYEKEERVKEEIIGIWVHAKAENNIDDSEPMNIDTDKIFDNYDMKRADKYWEVSKILENIRWKTFWTEYKYSQTCQRIKETQKREEAWKGKVTDVYMNDNDSQELLEKCSQTPVAVKESKIEGNF